MFTLNGERKVNLVDAIVYNLIKNHKHSFVQAWISTATANVKQIEVPEDVRNILGRIEYKSNRITMYVVSTYIKRVLYFNNLSLSDFKRTAEHAAHVTLLNNGKAKLVRIFRQHSSKLPAKLCYIFAINNYNRMQEALSSEEIISSLPSLDDAPEMYKEVESV